MLLLLVFAHLWTEAQIPAGGISLIKETGINYQKSGAKGTLAAITITNQPFTTGFKYTTGTDITNSWDGQVKFSGIAGIAANDIVLVAFYARTTSSLQETGDGALTVCIENNVTYAKEIYQKVAIGREWKQYFAPLKCASTLATSAVNYSFHIGFASQTIEVADVKYLNYKNTLTLDQLPVTEITYYGREADAAWRAPAAERINQIRKGLVDMVVYDEQGQVLKDAVVSVEMVKHQFGFGSAVDATRFMNDVIYRKKVYELFNEVVLENDLKWPSFNPNPSLNTTRTLDSLARHKIAVRGHNLVWPSFNYNLASLKTLSTNPVAFRTEIERHIDQATLYAKGKVIDWDVLNEPYTNTEFQAILGNDVMADWFKRVRRNDRKVKLYINDYSILSAGGMDLNHQNGYFDIIKSIDSKGGKIEGIGMQGHFGSDLTPITKVYSILERYATLGKEIKITEHDIDVTQRAVQADYTRDFMTIVFSHPSVKSFLTWGFWAGQHWMPEAAFYAKDWTIRPHGEAWKELVFNQWWTKKMDKTTDAEGKVSFDGFLGTYKYTITSGNKVRTGTFSINNSKQSALPNQVILSFDTSIPDNISITTTQPACLCEGENVTLNATTGTGLTYQWFRGSELLPDQTASLVASQSGFYSVKVSKGSIEFTSAPIEVVVNPIPKAEITTSGDLSFCPGGKVKLSANVSNELTYTWMKGTTKIQGSVTSLDISESGSYKLVTNAYGCSATSAPVAVNVYAATDPACTNGVEDYQNSIKVYPNPFKDQLIVETSTLNGSPFMAELFDATGSLLFKQQLDKETTRISIPVATSGFYILRVSNKDMIKNFKLNSY
ncbi:MAG TPA: endo-1,4-beta-xylanase [Prolixibacteraceae bacterium]|jgi:GH35 family endo-1,4-beta-xylanase